MATFDVDIEVDSSNAVRGLTNLENEVNGASRSVEDLQNNLDELNTKASGLDKTSKEFEELNEEIKRTRTELNQAKSSFSGLEGNLNSVSKGFNGVGLAIKATGIGLVLSLFSALKRVLESQQPVLDAVETGFTAISLAVSAVIDVLTDVFKAQSDANGGFDASATIIGNLITLSLAPFRLALLAIEGTVLSAQLAWEASFFGGGDEDRIEELKQGLIEVGEEVIELGKSVIKASTSIVENFGEAVDEVGGLVSAVVGGISEIDAEAILSQAKAVTALKNRAAIAEAVNKGILEQYDRIAERDRQLRDDTLLSIDERISANERLGESLEMQEILMLRNARLVVSSASAELSVNNNIENRVALINAQNEVSAVEATIEGFRSEQLINRIGLEQELNVINQTSIDRIAQRGIAERDFNAQQIENDLQRIKTQQENLIIEEESETIRLQNVIDNFAENTQARVDAEQNLSDSLLLFSQRNTDLDTERTEAERAQSDQRIENAKNEANEKAEAAKALQDFEDSIRDQNLNNISNGLKLLAGLDSENRALQATAIIAESAVSVGKQIISTQAANVAIVAEGAALAIPTLGASVATAAALVAANNISLGIGLAGTALATGTALTALNSGGSAPSASVPSSPTPTSAGSGNIDTSGPTSTFVGTAGQTGGSTDNQAGTNQQPIIIQNNILESDITNAQDNVAQIIDFASFGGPG